MQRADPSTKARRTPPFVLSCSALFSLTDSVGGDLMRTFFEKVTSRSAVVGVIGQGYVGLPLALVFAEAGFRAIGFDIDPRKVETLRRGQSYIKHVGSERVAAEPPRTFLRDHRIRSPCRLRRHLHLRSHAPRQASRAGQLIYSSDRHGNLRSPSPWTARGTRIDNLPRNHRRRGFPHLAKERPGVAPGFFSRLLARTGRPRKPDVLDEIHSEGRRWYQPGIHRRRDSPLPSRLGKGSTRVERAHRGVLQATREHLSFGQHCSSQRTQDDIHAHGNRHLGGHRGRKHETLRLYAVLSWSRAGRALHPTICSTFRGRRRSMGRGRGSSI